MQHPKHRRVIYIVLGIALASSYLYVQSETKVWQEPVVASDSENKLPTRQDTYFQQDLPLDE